MPDIRSTIQVQARDFYMMPTGGIADTMPRTQIANSGAPTTAVLYLFATALRSGQVVSNFNIRTHTTAMASGTNQWMALFDSSRVQLACSADQALAAMAATTTFTWPVATDANGAASLYVVPSTGLYYVGMMLKATTMCTLPAMVAPVAMTLAPILYGTSNTAQAGVNAFPFTATALTSVAFCPYLWLS